MGTFDSVLSSIYFGNFNWKFGMFYEKKRLKQEGCFIYHGGDNPVTRHCVPWAQCSVGQEGERKEKAGSFESKNYGIKFNANMSSFLILTLNI